MHWFRRHWRGITGAALLAWQGVDWLLKWAEHVQFITERAEHLGEARKVIDFLANPPSMAVPIAILGGLFLVWWDVKRRILPAPESPAEPSPAPSSESVPNLTVRELFFHIRPDLRDDHQAKEWRSVGRDVMDKFSTEQLKVWGSRMQFPSRHRESLAPIDPKYWSRAEFTYWFLKDDDHRLLTHAMPRTSWRSDSGGLQSRDPEYADLRVNRAQAESIWPPFIPITEASRTVYEATEGTTYDGQGTRLDKTATERLRRHIDAFLIHKFELWGKSPPSTTRHRILETDMATLRWIEGTNSLGSQFASQRGRCDDVVITRTDLMKYIAFLKRMET